MCSGAEQVIDMGTGIKSLVCLLILDDRKIIEEFQFIQLEMQLFIVASNLGHIPQVTIHAISIFM